MRRIGAGAVLKEHECVYRQYTSRRDDNRRPRAGALDKEAEHSGYEWQQNADTNQSFYHLVPPFSRKNSFSVFLRAMASPFNDLFLLDDAYMPSARPEW
jgi:hypothetical protein